jgi:hypothetical protein
MLIDNSQWPICELKKITIDKKIVQNKEKNVTKKKFYCANLLAFGMRTVSISVFTLNRTSVACLKKSNTIICKKN